MNSDVWGKAYKGEILIEGKVLYINNQFYTYAGDFESIEDVPRTICCYTIGDEFHVRNSIPNLDNTNIKLPKRKRPDDDKPINTVIKDSDNSLMVMIKTGLKHKGITKGDFKAAYNSDSDMHNALWCVENGDNLSWSRFTDMCQRFDLDYDLCLYDTDKTSSINIIEEIDTGGKKRNK